MSGLLTWPPPSVVYICCGSEMEWDVFRGVYVCACGVTR
jgi:hypothetical protein